MMTLVGRLFFFCGIGESSSILRLVIRRGGSGLDKSTLLPPGLVKSEPESATESFALLLRLKGGFVLPAYEFIFFNMSRLLDFIAAGQLSTHGRDHLATVATVDI
jgi:hypothetical protein